ncbi:hypothetical protein AKO1_007249 [Acrasis kona]|uniref:Homeobox domain-containing protein n=1 Tax=Acrasis kona TaxID=1008807 RepID=A0AAW2YU43_9EUKA
MMTSELDWDAIFYSLNNDAKGLEEDYDLINPQFIASPKQQTEKFDIFLITQDKDLALKYLEKHYPNLRSYDNAMSVWANLTLVIMDKIERIQSLVELHQGIHTNFELRRSQMITDIESMFLQCLSSHNQTKTTSTRQHVFIPREATNLLHQWFMAHIDHPYPNELELEMLSQQTGLDHRKIKRWFVNKRTRNK